MNFMETSTWMKKLSLATSGTVAWIAFGLALSSSPASAALLVRNSFQDAALSIDAFGSPSNSGLLQTNVPSGATVVGAYLYSSSIWNFGPVNDVKLNGNLLSTSAATVLTPNANPTTTVVWDVTSILKSIIEGGPGGLQNHTIEELGNNDGQTLVVAYKSPLTVGYTSFILDGELATGGDTTTFNFASPYTSGDFFVSLADTFSYQPANQYSKIDVTTDSTLNRRLTSSAGGQDDGSSSNGALITAGGIGDNPANPDPFATDSGGPRTDDEYYNLALGNIVDPTPFIKSGDTFLQLKTQNPSNDDNVYGLFITSTFKLNTPQVKVPEPASTLGLLALGAMGAGSMLKRKQQQKATVKA
jgi:hypothetical protein